MTQINVSSAEQKWKGVWFDGDFRRRPPYPMCRQLDLSEHDMLTCPLPRLLFSSPEFLRI